LDYSLNCLTAALSLKSRVVQETDAIDEVLNGTKLSVGIVCLIQDAEK
jgi:hypothetical protein